jgi:transcriptional regulator with XRE-family HTH domain
MREDIRQARLKKGFTQQQIADAIGTRQGTVSRYESGAIPIDAEVAPKLAKILGMRILAVLYGGTEREAA